MSDDIVRRFLSLARELHPETPTAEWTRLEVRLRQEFGGERVYILKERTMGKAWSLAERLAAGDGWREALAATGISRRTGCRMRRRLCWVTR